MWKIRRETSIGRYTTHVVFLAIPPPPIGVLGGVSGDPVLLLPKK